MIKEHEINTVIRGPDFQHLVTKSTLVKTIDMGGLVMTRGIDGKGYVATDVRTGMSIAKAKTKKALFDILYPENPKNESPYRKWKEVNAKKGFYDNYLIVNEVGIDGKWHPKKGVHFYDAECRKAYKLHAKKGQKWNWHEKYYRSFNSEKELERCLKDAAKRKRPNSIVKTYGVSGKKVTRVTSYKKGFSEVERFTIFKRGRKSPKGEKMISKRYDKE